MDACFESDFAPRLGETDWENMPIPYTVPKHELDYNAWLQKGRDITQEHGNIQWNVGDWVADGRCAFDYKDIVGNLGHLALTKTVKDDGSTGYKGPTIPHFWKDVATETDMAVSTLKNLSRISLAYPPAKRYKDLSWTHHAEVAQYEKRYEYLALCFDERSCLGPKRQGRPRSVAWLVAYVENIEGKTREISGLDSIVRFYVSPETYKKLRQVSKYYHTKISALIGTRCEAAVGTFLEEMAEKVSLARDGVYEGEWPFEKLIDAGRRKRTTSNKTGPRRYKRGDAVAQKHGKEMTAGRIHIRTIRRGDLVA